MSNLVPRGDESLAAAHERMQAEVRAGEAAAAGSALWQITARAMEIERERLAAEKAAARQRQEADAERLTEEARQHALGAWLAAGGTEASFKESWPAMRREQLREAAAHGLTAQERLVEAKKSDPMYAVF